MPGDPTDQSPFRSELGGVVGILTTLHSLCTLHNISSGKVTIGLDCESAIHSIASDQLTKAKNKDFDMIHEAKTLLRTLPIAISFHWIKGHQDKDSNSCLDWWARQNIRMDQKAKRFWRKHANNPRPAQILSSAVITIAIGNHSLTHIPKNTAYKQINTKPIQENWKKKK
jgi:hypothetical protein